MSTQSSPESSRDEFVTHPPRLLSQEVMLGIVESGSRVADDLAATADLFDETFNIRSVKLGLLLGAQMAEHWIRHAMTNNWNNGEKQWQ